MCLVFLHMLLIKKLANKLPFYVALLLSFS